MKRIIFIFAFIFLHSHIYQSQDSQISIDVVNVESLKILQTIEFDEELFPDIAFDNNSQKLAIINVGGAPNFNNTTTLFNIIDSGIVLEYQHEIAIAQTITFTPDNDQYLIGTKGIIYFFDAVKHELINSLKVDTSAINHIDFSPNGEKLVISVGCSGCGAIPIMNNLIVLDSKTFKEDYSFPALTDGHGLGIGMDYSDDGQFIAYGTTNDDVHIIDAETGEKIDTLTGIFAPRIKFHVERQTLTFIAKDGIRIWDIEPLYRGETIQDFDLIVQHETGTPNSIQDYDLSSDGSLLAVGHFNGVISFWDVETATQIASFEAHNRVTNIEFSPDNTLLVSAGIDGDVIVWHIPNKE